MLSAALLLAAPPKADLRLERASDGLFRATLTNRSRELFQLLATQDGSAVHWSAPYVNLLFLPDDGSPLPAQAEPVRTPRCGNVNPIEPGHFSTLEPGKTAEVSLHWLPRPELKPGRYRAVLYYRVEPSRTSQGLGVSNDPAILARYAALTPLALRSNPVRLTVTTPP